MGLSGPIMAIFELLVAIRVGVNDFVQSKSLRFMRYCRLGQFSFAPLPFRSIGFHTELIPLFLETASQSGSTQGRFIYLSIFLFIFIQSYIIVK